MRVSLPTFFRSYAKWFAAAAILWVGLGFFSRIRFYQEEIDVTLSPGVIRVEGVYHFKNPWPFPVLQPMVYPIPSPIANPLIEPPTTRMADDEAQGVKMLGGGGEFRMRLFFWPFEQVDIVTQYRQAAPQNQGVYILTTTRTWNRPLEQARFRLFCDETRLVSSNYELADGDGFQTFTRTDFLPDEDWRLAWEETP